MRTLQAKEAALAAVAAGGLYATAQPSWGAWPLASVCLVPLLAALRGRGPAARAALGWAAGTTATLLSTVVPATAGSQAYWGVPLWMGVVIAMTVGQVFGAGSFALATVCCGDPDRASPLAFVARTAAAWVAAEFARSVLFTGLPWLMLAHALASTPALIQAAELGGELLLTFGLAALNASFLLLATARRTRAGVVGIAAVGLAFAAASGLPASRDASSGPGSVRLANERSPKREGSIRVLLAQGNVPNAWRGDPGRVDDALDRLVDVTAGRGDLDLAVWPENAVSALLPMNEPLIRRATARLGTSPDFLLLGTPRIDEATPPRVYNSAALFDGERRAIGFHDKVHLVPFAEYDPWPGSAIGRDGRDTAAGAAPRILRGADFLLGPLVCYEIVFAGLSRSLVRDGADLLVNISNDAWFGTTGAVEQHFASAVFRAVETRRPLLRATNTGITAAIDAYGRVVGRLPAERTAALVVDVTPGRGFTWAVRLGDAVGLLGLFASAVWLAWDRFGASNRDLPRAHRGI